MTHICNNYLVMKEKELQNPVAQYLKFYILEFKALHYSSHTVVYWARIKRHLLILPLPLDFFLY